MQEDKKRRNRMRYLCVVAAVLFALGASPVAAEEAGKESGGDESVTTETKAQEPAGAAHRHETSDDKEFGEDNGREMPQNQTHDENTGLPNVVDSDKTGEL